MAVVCTFTGEVVVVNVTLLAPAFTVTLAGTDALVLLELKLITAPPLGAGPARVTVPVELTPPLTAAGLNVREASAGGLMVRLADAVLPASLAVMMTVVCATTAEVVAVNVALVMPAETVPLAGTDAAALLLDRVSTTPPAGAGTDKVTAPVEVFPPVTAIGLIVSDVTAGGSMVRLADAVFVP